MEKMEPRTAGGMEVRTASLPRFKFLQISSQNVLDFVRLSRGGSSRDLLVWMLALNALRVCKRKELRFTPRWRAGVCLSQKTVYRSLRRLQESGLLRVVFRRGKSPIISQPQNSCVMAKNSGVSG